jgi:hypothetical protein
MFIFARQKLKGQSIAADPDGTGVRYGCVHIPEKELCYGTLFMGSPGTGKSSLMKMMISQCAVQGLSGAVLNIGENYCELLESYAPKAKVVNFAAHKQNGVGIDFAAMVQTAGQRVRFCEKLAPLLEGANMFFDARVQIVLQSALQSLHVLAPGEWKLRDALNLSFNSELLETVTELTRVPNPYLAFGKSSENRTRSDVQATVEAKLLPLRVYAAMNARCGKLVNPLDVLEEENTWHIYEWSDRTAAVNESVISFALDEVAFGAMEERRRSPLAICLDEIAALKPLNFLLAAGRRGRKANIAVAASMHERSSINKYKEDAEEILALLRTKLFFQISSPQSAKWASDYLGTPEVLESLAPELERDKGGTTQRNRSIKDRPLVHPDELRILPKADYHKDRVDGYVLLPDGTAGKFWTPFRDATTCCSQHFSSPIDPEDEDLAPMTVEDLRRLNIPTDPRTKSLLNVHKKLKKRNQLTSRKNGAKTDEST